MVMFDQADVINGDCKAYLTPWTAEEVFAVRNLKIPAELVRKGILTLEQYNNIDVKDASNGKNKTKEEDKKDEVVESTAEEEIDTNSAEEIDIYEAYEEKFGKKVPVRYKNDKDWILNKLNS